VSEAVIFLVDGKMSEIVGRIKDRYALLEKIESVIPGFRGYKEKEIRRESDRLVRDHVYSVLYEAKQYLRDALVPVIEAERREFYPQLNRIIAKLDRLAEQINHADYGYSGFFNAVKIKEPELDLLIEYDYNLISLASDIRNVTLNLKQLAYRKDFNVFGEKLLELESKIARLDEAVIGRERIIRGV